MHSSGLRIPLRVLKVHVQISVLADPLQYERVIGADGVRLEVPSDTFFESVVLDRVLHGHPPPVPDDDPARIQRQSLSPPGEIMLPAREEAVAGPESEEEHVAKLRAVDGGLGGERGGRR
jgi:hypothetical protein